MPPGLADDDTSASAPHAAIPPTDRARDPHPIRWRIALSFVMLVVIGVEVPLSIFFLIAGATASAEDEAVERFLFSRAVLFSGMLLVGGAIWFSQRAALTIGAITVGGAVWVVDPFMFAGAVLLMILAGPAVSGPNAPEWPRSPTHVPASVVALLSVLLCWMLAALTYNPLYLGAAVVALAIPSWPPFSWVGIVVVAFATWGGYAEVTGDPPYFGVREPVRWFVVAAVLSLGAFCAGFWLIDTVRDRRRAQRDATTFDGRRLALPFLAVLALVLAVGTLGKTTWQDMVSYEVATEPPVVTAVSPLPTPLPARPDTAATGINDTGQAVGTSIEIGHGYQAVVWTPRTTLEREPPFPGDWCHAEAINNAGQVVGWCQNMATQDSAAVLWQNRQVIVLDGPADHDHQVAWDINDAGQVVGASGESMSTAVAALWQDGELVPLGGLPGHKSSSAQAINERGEIVGISTGEEGDVHAVLWWDGEIVDLGPAGAVSSWAADVNDAGLVVGGTRDEATDTGDAVLWDDGQMTVLPPLPGSRASAAEAINEAGQIVGHAVDEDSRSHAVLWEHGEVIDLGLLPGDQEAEAHDINASGHIVGVSRSSVPEQTTAVLWDHGRVVALPGSESVPAASPMADPVHTPEGRLQDAAMPVSRERHRHRASLLALPGVAPGVTFLEWIALVRLRRRDDEEPAGLLIFSAHLKARVWLGSASLMRGQPGFPSNRRIVRIVMRFRYLPGQRYASVLGTHR